MYTVSPLEIESATTEGRAEILPLSHRVTLHTSDARLLKALTEVCDNFLVAENCKLCETYIRMCDVNKEASFRIKALVIQSSF